MNAHTAFLMCRLLLNKAFKVIESLIGTRLLSTKTPDAVVDRLNEALEIVLNRKDLQERLAQQTGFSTKTAKPADAQAFLLEERSRWTDVLTKSPIDRK